MMFDKLKKRLKTMVKMPGSVQESVKTLEELHAGHNLIIGLMNSKDELIEREIPMTDVRGGRAMIGLLVKADERVLGVRCSCCPKGVYAAVPVLARMNLTELAKKEMVH